MSPEEPAAARDWRPIESLFDSLFGDRPAGPVLDLLRPLENERQEVRDFLARWLRLSAMAGVGPREMSPALAWALGVMIPSLLPGAWGNIIPPFTVEDRHVGIDRYCAENPWLELPAVATLIEMGCGFPPQTAVDVSRRFPDWNVIGADIRFDPYMVTESSGDYACLGRDGKIRYFQPASPSIDTLRTLYRNPRDTFSRFERAFQQLVACLPGDFDEPATAERDGVTLTRHPIRSYERQNLRLIEAGIGASVPAADIVRVFNVLIYFNAAFHQKTEDWALKTIRPGGLLLCGTDLGFTTEAHYAVSQRLDDRLVPREFAFSLDNLRPTTMMPWFCLCDDNPLTSLLARMVGVIRRDGSFRRAFDERLDELLAEERLWSRDRSGALTAPADQRPSQEWLPARLRIFEQLAKEGFVARAVSTLNASGIRAWTNVVGHIAIEPATA